MKKIIYTTILSLGILLFGACSEDIMDGLNENVNDPENVASSLTLTDLMTKSAFSNTGSDLAFYSSLYIEHNVGIYGQMYDAEIRSNEPTSSTTYNNSWNNLYETLLNLKTVIEKCSEGGEEEGNFHNLGIAQILSAYNLAILTDLMGDVPWTEALQPGVIFTPKLDSQESIYAEIFNFLDAGIENLGKESNFPPLYNQDFIYYDFSNPAAAVKAYDAKAITNWIKFGYGLKARYTMRLSLKTPNYADVITFADKSFANASEEAKFNYSPPASKSPFYSFYTDRNYFGASLSLHNKLIAKGDPRDSVYFKPAKDQPEIEFAPNGTVVQAQNKYGISALSVVSAPTYLMSYHELEFLKAEAYARQGASFLPQAKEALKKAITASFAKSNVGLSKAMADTYYDDKVAGRLATANSALEEIMVQKYMAFFEEEAIEAYNDYRRLKAMGDNFIKLENPLKFPLRFTYGSEDVTTNENVRSAYGDGSYVYTENVWWAGGTR